MSDEQIKKKFEIQFKDCFSELIFNAIRTANNELSTLAPDGKWKLVIGGGSALNYYIREELSEGFKTHDFDLRIIYDALLPPGESEEYKAIMTNLIIFRKKCCSRFLDILNGLIKNPNISQMLYNFVGSVVTENPNISFGLLDPTGTRAYHGEEDLFYTEDNNDAYRVQPIFFNYSINSKIERNAIIDVICYGRHFPYYGYPNLSDTLHKYTDEKFVEDAFSGEGYIGGFRNILSTNYPQTIVTDSSDIGNLYYVSLGYLVWDTVRMINWSRSAGNPKFGRYLGKYLGIIETLNSPFHGLRCISEPFKQYRNVCREKEIQDILLLKDLQKREKEMARLSS